MNTRADIINYFIKQRNYKTYLEIGLYDGENLLKVECSEKIGVDPSFEVLHKDARKYCVKMTSDDFFADIPDDQLFDIIFIDGDHRYEQVVKDIANSKKHLSANGVIVMHDVILYKEEQTIDRCDTMYMGTTYQAFIQQIMMNELDHKYNVYYTGVDLTGVIDTQSDHEIIKDDNLLTKYVDIIKSYIDIQEVDDICNNNNLYSLVAIYRMGFPDYIKNQDWIYPKVNL